MKAQNIKNFWYRKGNQKQWNDYETHFKKDTTATLTKQTSHITPLTFYERDSSMKEELADIIKKQIDACDDISLLHLIAMLLTKQGCAVA